MDGRWVKTGGQKIPGLLPNGKGVGFFDYSIWSSGSYLMDVLDVSFMKFCGKLVRYFYGIHVTW